MAKYKRRGLLTSNMVRNIEINFLIVTTHCGPVICNVHKHLNKVYRLAQRHKKLILLNFLLHFTLTFL